jgi:hypothetical protein
MGFYGNTDWPQFLTSAIWAPLIFLFLLRAAHGRKPIASGCLAGFFAGVSWLSGYHAPPIYFTLAALATLSWMMVRDWKQGARIAAAFLAVLGLVSALQILPAFEYGHTVLRWTATGALRWNDRVGFPEHVNSGFGPADLLHLVIQGADKQAEPFTGAIALCLAAIGIMAGFRRAEVRLFTAMAAVSLFLSMPRNVFAYGPVYALVPMFEKARAPALLMSVFHFAIAILAAFGLQGLISGASEVMIKKVARVATAFGVTVLLLYLIADFLRPTVNSTYLAGDSRPAMFGFLALLFSAVCFAAIRGAAAKPALATQTVAALVCLLALIEQGNVSGYYWVHNSEKDRRTFLKVIDESRSLADFLHAHQPSRVEVNRTDFGMFNFGDWNRLEAVEALVPTVPEITTRLGWWDDRSAKLFGVRYTISRKPTRAGQIDVFTSAAGMKIFENPGVLPRAWTVHRVRQATEDAAIAQVSQGQFDPALEAVITGEAPKVDVCPETDVIRGASFGLQSVDVDLEMACGGLLLVSDNWFPGWSATVDGASTPILQADATIRAVRVERGHHSVRMVYRPMTVIAGAALFIVGLCVTGVAVKRNEPDAEDLLT